MSDFNQSKGFLNLIQRTKIIFLIPVLAVFFILGGRVYAAEMSVPLTYSSEKSESLNTAFNFPGNPLDGTLTASVGSLNAVASVWTLDSDTLPAFCYADVNNITITSETSYDETIRPEDGSLLWLGDSATFNPAESISATSGNVISSLPLPNGVSWGWINYGGTNPVSSPVELSATWATLSTNKGDIVVVVHAGDGTTEISSTKPLATVNISDNSDCAPPQPAISTEPDSTITETGKPVVIDILSNDTGSNLTVTKIDNQNISPGQTVALANGSGSVTLNNDGTITFNPSDGFTGRSTFGYSIHDGTEEISTGAVIVDIASDVVTLSSSTTNTDNAPEATSPNASTLSLADTGSDTGLIITTGYLLIFLVTVVRLVLIFGFSRIRNNVVYYK